MLAPLALKQTSIEVAETSGLLFAAQNWSERRFSQLLGVILRKLPADQGTTSITGCPRGRFTAAALKKKMVRTMDGRYKDAS